MQKYIFVNIWFVIQRMNKYILYVNRISKGMQVNKSVKWNEMYKLKDDMKCPGYEPEKLYAQG